MNTFIFFFYMHQLLMFCCICFIYLSDFECMHVHTQKQFLTEPFVNYRHHDMPHQHVSPKGKDILLQDYNTQKI